jgi:hypothetical protein
MTSKLATQRKLLKPHSWFDSDSTNFLSTTDAEVANSGVSHCQFLHVALPHSPEDAEVAYRLYRMRALSERSQLRPGAVPCSNAEMQGRKHTIPSHEQK